MRYTDSDQFKTSSGYDINGTWYPRVTKILEIKSKPGLEQFLCEVGDFARAEEIKHKSAAHGTQVHESIQKLAVGAAHSVPEEVRPAVEAFREFNRERKILFLPEFIEKQVWSSRFRYAGTVDALAMVDGKFGVLDIKTSTGFFPEYNLQTAAYMSALQEFDVKRTIQLPRDIQTRWILRVDQLRQCRNCSATLREKGGRAKIRNGKNGTARNGCVDEAHEWGDTRGIAELREFPYVQRDIKAFIAAKTLWEWENDYWLRKIGYL